MTRLDKNVTDFNSALSQNSTPHIFMHFGKWLLPKVSDQYITIDKATMFTLLPKGMNPECLDEAKCEIEMGQMMQAAYIVTGGIERR